jgi:transcriptional regulator with XRE-family HTH domain
MRRFPSVRALVPTVTYSAAKRPRRPATPRSQPTRAARRQQLNQRIGERLGWIREEYERREPLHHGVGQWARALGVSASLLSRVERGEQTASLDLIDRICYFSGASVDFVFWGLLTPYMDPWLADALRRAHPTRIEELADFQRRRALMLQTSPIRPVRRQRRRGPRTGDDPKPGT